MEYTVRTNGKIERMMREQHKALRDLRPVSVSMGQVIVRLARRRAPVGQGAHRGAMKRSLNIDVPKHNKVILQSPLAYAGIQNRGGVIRPGTGPLKARLLAVPLNADARRMMDSLGASVSLKKLPEQLLLIQTRRGRFVLIRQLKQQFREMKQQRHVKGAGRKHRMFSGQVLFVLLPKATIQPNPPPEGYAPRWGDPEVRAGLGMAMRQHMRQSSGG